MKVEITNKNSMREYLDATRFVIRAISKQPSRYAIQYLCAEKGCLVATDGRRLHIAYLPHTWEEGFYEVIKSTKTQVVLLKADTDAKFPAWRDTVPHHSNYTQVCTTEPQAAVAMVLGGQGICVSSNYLKDAVAELASEPMRVFYGHEPGRPVRIIANLARSGKERIEAVLMPFTIGEVKATCKAIRRHYAKTS